MAVEQIKIRVGQVFKNRKSNEQLLIQGKKGDKWNAVVLTEKPGVYKGSHKMKGFVLLKKFELIR